MATYRENRLAKVAEANGLKYTSKDETGFVNFLLDFHLFKGRKMPVSNVLSCRDVMEDINFKIFDHVVHPYQVEIKENLFEQTSFFIRSKGLCLPHFVIQPKKEAIPVKIFFKSYVPPLSHGWAQKIQHYGIFHHPNGNMEKDVLNETLLKALDEHNDWYIEGSNYFLLLGHKARKQKTTDIVRFKDQCMVIFESLKLVCE